MTAQPSACLDTSIDSFADRSTTDCENSSESDAAQVVVASGTESTDPIVTEMSSVVASIVDEQSMGNISMISGVAAYPSEQPSVGSVKHSSGDCKACTWFPKGRCNRGVDCLYCHFDHDGRKKRAKPKKSTISIAEANSLQGSQFHDQASSDDQFATSLSQTTEAGSWRKELQKKGRSMLLDRKELETHTQQKAAQPSNHSREQYMIELEAQNAYLRACLMQCMLGAASA